MRRRPSRRPPFVHVRCGLDVERLLVKRHQSSGLKQEIDKQDVQARRIQAVVATRPHYWCESSSSLKTTEGVLQLRVFRGRRLSVAATAAMSLALCLLRSVPLGKY